MVITAQSSGSALGTGGITLSGGSLQINGIGTSTTTSAPSFSVGGGSQLIVNAAGGASTTLSIPDFSRVGNGTLVVTPQTGSLGSLENVQFTGTQPTNNGMIDPWVVVQPSGTNSAASFANVSGGNLVAAAYSSSTNINTAGSSAIFNATTAQTVSKNTSVYALAVNAANVTIAPSGTLTIGNGTNPAGLILNNGAGVETVSSGVLAFGGSEAVIYTGGTGTSTLSADITGSGGLTTFGNGTLTLGGINTFTGTVTLNAGTINIARDSALGAATNPVVLAGGSIQSSSGYTIANPMTLEAPTTISVSPSNRINQTTLAFSGAIGGAGPLIDTGTGILELSGNNTYSGGTIIGGAVLAVASSGATPLGTGPVTLNSGTLEFESYSSTPSVGAIAVAGGSVVSGGSSLIDVNSVSRVGNATLEVVGATLNFSSPPPVTNGMVDPWIVVQGIASSAASFATIRSNELTSTFNSSNLSTATATSIVEQQSSETLTTSKAIYALDIAFGPLTIHSGVTLTIGNGTNPAGLILNSASGITGGTLNFGSSEAVLFAGEAPITSITSAIAGSGGLTKSGADLLILSGANTYSGTTTIDAGTLEIPRASSLGNSSSLVVSGTLLASGTMTLSQPVTLGPTGGTLNAASGESLTLSGPISGSAAAPLTTGGAGTLVLSGNNSYAGGTVISAGVLSISSDQNLGSSAGALTFNGGTLAVTTDGYTSSRNFEFNSQGAIDIAGTNTATLNGVLSGAYSLAKIDTGTLVLTNASNSMGGVLVNGGTLTVAAGGTISGLVTINSTGGASTALNLNGPQSVRSLSGTVSGEGTATLNLNGSSTILSSVTFTATTFGGQIIGTGGLEVSGSTGSPGLLTLAGANTYSGGTTIGIGATISISADNNLGSLVGGLALNDGTLQATSSFVSSRDITLGTSGGTIDVVAGQTLTIGTAITGSGSLTKTDAGTLVLDAANTPGGSIIINGGTLVGLPQSSGSPFGTAPIQINGATLQTTGLATSGSVSASSVTAGVGESYLNINAAAGGATTISVGSISRDGSGTLVVVPQTGSLNANEVLTITSPPPLTAGILSPWMLGQTSGANPNLNFLTLVGNNVAFANTSGTDINVGASNANTFLASSSSNNVLSANQSWYAVQNNGQNISGNYTLALGNGSGQAGLILNAAQVTAQGLGFGAAEGVVATGGSGGSTISSAITGSGGLTIAGTQTLTLSGTSTFTGGVNLTGGNLSVGADANLGNANNSLNFLGGALTATGSFSHAGAVTLGANQANVANVSTGQTLSLNGTVSGSGALTLQGPGALTLGNTSNTYSGGTNINGGSLLVGADGALGSSAGAVNLNGGTLVATGTFSSSRDYSVGTGGGTIDVQPGNTFTVSSTLTGSGNLSVVDSGTMALSGYSSTYTGNISIGGNLQVDSFIGNSTITVNSGGTLSGSSGGTIGTVTVAAGGTISPGDGTAPGQLFSNSAVTLDGNSRFNLFINNATGSSGPGSAGTGWGLLWAANQVIADASLTPSTPLQIELTTLTTSNTRGTMENFNPAQSYSWEFILGPSGSSEPVPADFVVNTANFENAYAGTFSVTTDSFGDFYLDYTPSSVPEPTTLVLGAIAAFGLAGGSWRRRRNASRQQQLVGTGPSHSGPVQPSSIG